MEVHVIPMDDTEPHIANPSCACYPLKHPDGTWTHNAWDTREKLERQGIATGKQWGTYTVYE
jgi:hypothetical protein